MFGFTFKKGLGQNFLASRKVIEEIASCAQSDGGVLEIGPGFGVLTHALSAHADKVVTVEIDKRLNDVLAYTLADCSNVKVINADVMKLDLKKLIADEFGDMPVNIAANLPYYITTPIITRLIEERLPVKSIVVMVQKEAAQRMCAQPGTKDYGAITLLCRYFTDPSIVTTVPARLFVPPPKVDSAVLKMTMLSEPRVKVKNEAVFFKTVKAAFAQRRKTLLNCLAASFPIPKTELAQMLESIAIAPSCRGETLSIEEFARLSDILR